MPFQPWGPENDLLPIKWCYQKILLEAVPVDGEVGLDGAVGKG